MFGIHDLWLFVVSGLLLNITPGPDVLYIIGRSTTQGRRAGAVAALGIGAGALVHVTAASLGLSALLAASATAFLVVKMIGAAYLVYVGVSLLRSAKADPADGNPADGPAKTYPAASLRQIFMQGFLTNMLNPKVALFFLAFLPQFVTADAPFKPIALLLLGLIFDVNGTVWNLLVAWSAGSLSRHIAGGSSFRKWFDRSVGALFVCVGVRLALSGER
jgi:threonine/homoserine/homoserine lactone efflux protein